MRCSDLRRIVAVALVLTTTFITTPLSAADFTSRNVLGSVSAVGNVQLRGIPISQEGTLFAGDTIRAAEKAYAKVVLQNGTKIEVGEKTEISVNKEAVAVLAGNLGFTSGSKNAIRIAFQPFELVATDAAGNVSVNAGTAAGVRAVSGKVTVRNTKTSESFVLSKGQERWFALKDGSTAKPITELASNLPDSIPLPQTPAGQTGGGLAMDAGAWAAVIAAGAVAGLAIWGLVVALDNQDDIDALGTQISDLGTRITGLQGTITANQAATTAALAALQRAQAFSEAAFNARLNVLAIANTAAQAQTAVAAAPNLTSAQRATFTSRAQTIASQANTAAQNVVSLEAQINALQAQIAASGTVTAAQQTQLNTFRDQLNAAIAAVNAARAAEQELLADLSNAGVQGVTSGSTNTGGVSASIPQ